MKIENCKVSSDQTRVSSLRFSIYKFQFSIIDRTSYMRFISCFVIVCSLALSLVLVHATHAQDEPRAAWAVLSYDITVPGIGAERALTARATINARNIGRGPGSTLTVRINSTAE